MRGVMSKLKVQRVISERLGLDAPRFRLKTEGGMVFGSVISPTFKRMDDLERVRSIRDAIESGLDTASARDVGTILAYTPEEWELDAPTQQRRNGARPRRRHGTGARTRTEHRRQ